jgi:hypothetical protein
MVYDKIMELPSASGCLFFDAFRLMLLHRTNSPPVGASWKRGIIDTTGEYEPAQRHGLAQALRGG